MKTKLVAGFIALILASACGELSPDKVAEIERNNNNNPSRIDPTALTVSSLQVNSVESQDLLYVATYEVSTRLFSFLVRRANQAVVNKTVLLASNNAPEIYSALSQIFTGKRSLQSNPCGSASVALVTGLNGGTLSYSCPSMIATVNGRDLLPALNSFILNRL